MFNPFSNRPWTQLTFDSVLNSLDSSPNIQEPPRTQAPVAVKRGAPTAFMGMLTQFGYEQPDPQTPTDNMRNAYRSTSSLPRQQIHGQQTAPSRAMPGSSAPVYQRIEDIVDYVYRGKTVHIQRMLPSSTVQQCMTALTIKNGSVSDALEWLVEQEEPHTREPVIHRPLTSSPLSSSVSMSSSRRSASREVAVPSSAVRDFKQEYDAQAGRKRKTAIEEFKGSGREKVQRTE